jgi:predicted aspartyl protease
MPGRMRRLLALTFYSDCYWRKGMVVVLFLLLNTEVGRAQQGKIYTWTDKNGVVHFSDSVSSPQDFSRAQALTPQSRPTMQKGKGGHEEIPLVTFADRPSQKFVRVQLEGERETRDVLMLVDTGAQISLVDQQTAKELELEHLEEATLRGVNGVTKSWIGRLPSLRVGEEEVRDLRVLVGPQPGLVLLGMDVLDRLKLSVGPQSLHRR